MARGSDRAGKSFFAFNCDQASRSFRWPSGAPARPCTPARHSLRLEAAPACAPRLPPPSGSPPLPTRADSRRAARARRTLRRQMMAWQEELDWHCYRPLRPATDSAASVDADARRPPEVALGERAFEIVLARRMAAGSETDHLVRAPRLDADHRDPGALARGLPPGRRSAAST